MREEEEEKEGEGRKTEERVVVCRKNEGQRERRQKAKKN